MGAIEYAEDTLKVHEILEKTIEARDRLDGILTDLSNSKDAKRLAENELSDFEMRIASDERGRHPEMSATAMEKHLKLALHGDIEWRGIRDRITELTNDIDGFEFDRKMAERDIEIGVARMNQLGGYLNYLAAVKNAATAAKAAAS